MTEDLIEAMVEAAKPYRVVLVKLGLKEWTDIRSQLRFVDGKHHWNKIPVDYASRRSAIIVEVAQ